MATSSAEARVATFAFYSRILVLFLQAFFNNFIPDHLPDVFNPPRPDRPTVPDKLVEVALEGLNRWDGVYFTHIAEHGYTYENCAAFFPLFPLLVRLTSDALLFPLQHVMSARSALMLSAALLNLLFFIQAARTFHALSLRALRDETLAFRAAQLFCINPASIFFSAAYTESLYCWLTLEGMLHCERGQRLVAACFFALSGATRSNGVVNAGFLLYVVALQFLQQVRSKSRRGRGLALLHALLVRTVAPAALYTLICLTPFFLYQYYIYSLYCDPLASPHDMEAHLLTYGMERKYHMSHSGLSPYCHWTLPLSYSYVQSHHWGVGFLTYYTFKQLPNFLLALPMIVLCACAVGTHFRSVLPRVLRDPDALWRPPEEPLVSNRVPGVQLVTDLDALRERDDDLPQASRDSGPSDAQTQHTESEASTVIGGDVGHVLRRRKQTTEASSGLKTQPAEHKQESAVLKKRKSTSASDASEKPSALTQTHPAIADLAASGPGGVVTSAGTIGAGSAAAAGAGQGVTGATPGAPELPATAGGAKDAGTQLSRRDEAAWSDTCLQFFCTPHLLVYVVHLLFLTIVGVFFMHVQVITRFVCSASPVVFWFITCLTTPASQLRAHLLSGSGGGGASSLTDDMMDWDHYKSITSKLLFCYVHLYFFVGIAAFANFLPWT